MVNGYIPKEQRKKISEKLLNKHVSIETKQKMSFSKSNISELTRESYTIRAELDTLKNIGHNARQELRIY